MPQEPILFNGTIRDNIRYGNLEATDAEIETAARIANVEEFAAPLPLGYDTILGERGITLSGGQRQRVAIARAVLKNPPALSCAVPFRVRVVPATPAAVWNVPLVPELGTVRETFMVMPPAPDTVTLAGPLLVGQ